MTKIQKIVGTMFFVLALLSALTLVIIAGSSDHDFARQASRVAPCLPYFSLGCIASISKRLPFRGLCALIAHVSVFLMAIDPVLAFCFVLVFFPLWFFLFYQRKQKLL